MLGDDPAFEKFVMSICERLCVFACTGGHQAPPLVAQNPAYHPPSQARAVPHQDSVTLFTS